MIDFLMAPFEFGFMQRALLGGVLVGAICALVGTYVVLRGLAFIGDALAHAAFPGVVIAYLLKGNIYLGATIFALATAMGIGLVSRRGRVSYDTAIGILFAGAFALGVLLMSTIHGYTVDLFSFLFGNVLGISARDLLWVGLLGAIVVLTIILFYKDLLLGLIALTIVISIQAVGIILVVALLVTPSATASLLTERFFRMMMLGALLAALAAVT